MANIHLTILFYFFPPTFDFKDSMIYDKNHVQSSDIINSNVLKHITVIQKRTQSILLNIIDKGEMILPFSVSLDS